MNILFLPSWYPNEEIPFYGVFIKRHAQAVNLYNNVTVLTVYPLSFKKYFRIHKFFPEYSVEDGVNTIRLRYPNIPFFGFFFQLKAVFILLIKLKKRLKIDIIHTHIVWPYGYIGFLLGKVFKLPVVLSEHTGPFSNQMNNFIKRIIVRKVMGSVKRVFVVSEYLKNQIKKFNIKCNLINIANVVDTNVFKINKIRKNKRIKLLSVSSLIPEKGMIYLIKALSRIDKKKRNFILDIIGDGFERERLKQEVLNYDLQDNINFRGEISNQKTLSKYMSECNFYISPSLGETFGIVLIEAMACGKPVIATDCGGPAEIVNKNNGIIVNPESSEDIYKAIIYMFKNYKKYNNKKIREYAEKNYSFSAIGKKIDTIYIELVK